LYKSKKMNYPGLYGTFKKIDTSNIKKVVKKKILNDFDNDENLESLDNLIKNIKMKSKLSASDYMKKSAIQEPDEVDDTFVLEEELQELKKNNSFFKSLTEDDVSREATIHDVDTDEAAFSELITNNSYIDDIEKDLLQDVQTKQTDPVKNIIADLHMLFHKISHLTDSQKQVIAENENYKIIISELSARRGK